jgi:proteasome lid subunit RPN8/RPN11
MRVIKLSSVAVRSIRKAVQTDVEVCGFLVGHKTREQVCVEYARPVENIYDSKIAFAIGQEEYNAVLSEVDSHSRVVAIYHLHHGSPHLSCTDRHNILLYDLSWLVVSVSEKSRELRWKCFTPSRETIKRVAVKFDELIP